MKIDGAHVLLTGGSKGIGAELAVQLAAAGARLTLVARPSGELDDVAARTRAGSLPCDLSDVSSLTGLVEAAETVNGPVDVLVNNAALVRMGAFATLSAEDVRAPIVANLLAPMELVRQSLPGMKARRAGTIINVSSIAADSAPPHMSGYTVTKSGLNAFTLCLQSELRRSPVNAVLVIVGPVGGTQLVRDIEKDVKGARMSEMTAKLKTPTPAKVAERIVASIAEPRAVVIIPRLMAPFVHARLAPVRLASVGLR